MHVSHGLDQCDGRGYALKVWPRSPIQGPCGSSASWRLSPPTDHHNRHPAHHRVLSPAARLHQLRQEEGHLLGLAGLQRLHHIAQHSGVPPRRPRRQRDGVQQRQRRPDGQVLQLRRVGLGGGGSSQQGGGLSQVLWRSRWREEGEVVVACRTASNSHARHMVTLQSRRLAYFDKPRPTTQHTPAHLHRLLPRVLRHQLLQLQLDGRRGGEAARQADRQPGRHLGPCCAHMLCPLVGRQAGGVRRRHRGGVKRVGPCRQPLRLCGRAGREGCWAVC